MPFNRPTLEELQTAKSERESMDKERDSVDKDMRKAPIPAPGSAFNRPTIDQMQKIAGSGIENKRAVPRHAFEPEVPGAEPRPLGTGGFFSGIAEFGRGLAHGAVRELPKMAGGAMQFFDEEGGNDTIRDFGKDLVDFSEENIRRFPTLQESVTSIARQNEDPLSIRGGMHQGGSMFAPSMGLPLIGGMVGGAAGAAAGFAATMPMFYGGVGFETQERGIARGLSYEAARIAGHKTGAVEMFGELIADLMTFGTFRLLPWQIKKNIISSILANKSAKQLATDLGVITAAQVATEVVQNPLQANIEFKAGIRDQDWTAADALGVVVPTIMLSLLTFGGAQAIDYKRKGGWRQVARELADPSVDPAVREKAADAAFMEIQKHDQELGAQFAEYALDGIEKKTPIVAHPDEFFEKYRLGAAEEATGDLPRDGDDIDTDGEDGGKPPGDATGGGTPGPDGGKPPGDAGGGETIDGEYTVVDEEEGDRHEGMPVEEPIDENTDLGQMPLTGYQAGDTVDLHGVTYEIASIEQSTNVVKVKDALTGQTMDRPMGQFKTTPETATKLEQRKADYEKWKENKRKQDDLKNTPKDEPKPTPKPEDEPKPTPTTEEEPKTPEDEDTTDDDDTDDGDDGTGGTPLPDGGDPPGDGSGGEGTGTDDIPPPGGTPTTEEEGDDQPVIHDVPGGETETEGDDVPTSDDQPDVPTTVTEEDDPLPTPDDVDNMFDEDEDEDGDTDTDTKGGDDLLGDLGDIGEKEAKRKLEQFTENITHEPDNRLDELLDEHKDDADRVSSIEAEQQGRKDVKVRPLNEQIAELKKRSQELSDAALDATAEENLEGRDAAFEERDTVQEQIKEIESEIDRIYGVSENAEGAEDTDPREKFKRDIETRGAAHTPDGTMIRVIPDDTEADQLGEDGKYLLELTKDGGRVKVGPGLPLEGARAAAFKRAFPEESAPEGETSTEGDTEGDTTDVEGEPESTDTGEAPETTGLRRAISTYTGSKERWEGHRKTGLSDEDLTKAIATEAGTGGGNFAGISYTTKGTKRPEVTIRTATGTTVLKGKTLLNTVREVMGIPQPTEKPEDTTTEEEKPATKTEGTSANDIALLIEKVKSGVMVATAQKVSKSLPTIHELGKLGSTDHLGMGVFKTNGDGWEITWDGGGLMQRTGDGTSWTSIAVSSGEFAYDKDTILAELEELGQGEGGATSPRNDKTEPTEDQKEAENYEVEHRNVHGMETSIENEKGSWRWKLDTKRLDEVSVLAQSTASDSSWTSIVAELLKVKELLTQNKTVPDAFTKLKKLADDTLTNYGAVSEVLDEVIAGGWHVKMPVDYGRILGTVGADKDHVDISLGPDWRNPDLPISVIDQMKHTPRGERKKKPVFDEHKVFYGVPTDQVFATYVDSFEPGFMKYSDVGKITEFANLDEFNKWVYDKEATKKPAADYKSETKTEDETTASGSTEEFKTPTTTHRWTGLSQWRGIYSHILNVKTVAESDRLVQLTQHLKALLDNAAEVIGKETDIAGLLNTRDHVRTISENSGKNKALANALVEVMGARIAVLQSERDNAFQPSEKEKLQAFIKRISEINAEQLDTLIIGLEGNPEWYKQLTLAKAERAARAYVETVGKDLRKHLVANFVENPGDIPEDFDEWVVTARQSMSEHIDHTIDEFGKLIKAQQDEKGAADEDVIIAGRAWKIIRKNLDSFDVDYFRTIHTEALAEIEKQKDKPGKKDHGSTKGKPLRRQYELIKKDAEDADETDLDRFIKDIDEATTRARLFKAVPHPDATPGTQRWFDLLRNDILPFKAWVMQLGSIQWVTPDQPYKGETFRQWVDRQGDEAQFLAALKEKALLHIDAMHELTQWMNERSAKTVVEAANALFHFQNEQRQELDDAGYVISNYTHTLSLGIVLRSSVRNFTPPTFSEDGYRTGGFYTATLNAKEEDPTVKHTPIKRPPEIRDREGLPDHRKGKDVTSDELVERFGFAETEDAQGVTVGTGMNAKWTQWHLNNGYDAFSDLADELGISYKAIGLGGWLHYSIAALGYGKRHAAHFQRYHLLESGDHVPVINITRKQGDGSLAHEWHHALDYRLRDIGGIERNQHMAVRIMVELTQYRHHGDEIEWVKKMLNRFLKGGWHFKGTGKIKGAELENAHRWLKSHIYKVENGKGDKRGWSNTQWLNDAIELDKKRSPKYWSTDVELFARAAESALLDGLAGQEKINDYLVNNFAGDGVWAPPAAIGTPYPRGEERARVADVFQKFHNGLDWAEDGTPSVNVEKMSSDDGLHGMKNKTLRALNKFLEELDEWVAAEKAYDEEKKRQEEEKKKLADAVAAEQAQADLDAAGEEAEDTPADEDALPTPDDVDSMFDEDEEEDGDDAGGDLMGDLDSIPGLEQDVTPEQRAITSLIDAIIKDWLVPKRAMTHNDLAALAREQLKDMEWTARDVADSMEIALHKHIKALAEKDGWFPFSPRPEDSVQRRHFETEQTKRAHKAQAIVNELMGLIPSQTTRDREQLQFQQFSTPPQIAGVMAWVANIRPWQTVLEPSAGTGALATWADLYGARKIWVNENSERRANLLRELGYEPFTENAEFINTSVLPLRISPNVVLMNPPFSARASTRDKDHLLGAKHLEAALKRLAPGGRLVALLGQGAADQMSAHKDFWARIKGEYHVRANIPVAGSAYKKFGTNFGTQLIVIDKTGPTPTDSTFIGAGPDAVTESIGRGKDRRAAPVESLFGLLEEAHGATDIAGELAGLEQDSSGETGSSEADAAAGQDPRSTTDGVDPGTRADGSDAGPGTGGSGLSGSARVSKGPRRGDEKAGTRGSGEQTRLRERRSTEGGSTSPARRVGDSVGSEPERGDLDRLTGGLGKIGSGMGDIASALAIIITGRSKGGTLHIGFPMGLDPEAYAAAKPLFEQGWKDVKEGAADVEQAVASAAVRTFGLGMKKRIRTHLGEDKWKSLRPYLTHFINEKVEDIRIERAQADEGLGDNVFEPYVVRQNKSMPEGAREHPGELVESAAMASVEHPEVDYELKLPPEVIDPAAHGHPESKGASKAQLEGAIQSGAAWLQILPDGKRRAYAYGDGTGLGKGREVGIPVLDNWGHGLGNKKAVWVTANTSGLYPDAQRDWADLLQDPKQMHKQNDTPVNEPIKWQQGIMVTSYPMWAQNASRVATVSDEEAAKPEDERDLSKIPQSRIQQIVDWVGGPTWDGILAFDEAHKMGNNMRNASAAARAGQMLRDALPNARILYLSATFASEVSQLGYLDRLGLWGRGTPFDDKFQFVQEIEATGVRAMEGVSQNMKALGLMQARSLSYDDVSYDRLQHKLTDDQHAQYNTMARSWQTIWQNINQALTVTMAADDADLVGRIRRMFWQRELMFFSQVVTSMQMPSVLADAKAQLAQGKAVVFQLVNTNEAPARAELAKLEAAAAENQEEIDYDEFDLTPRAMLARLVDLVFPIRQYEPWVPPGETEAIMRPMSDSEGNPVINPEALAAKNAMLQQITQLNIPQGPLEYLVNEFGPKNVAEITGRGFRIVNKRWNKENPNKDYREDISPVKWKVDLKRFLDDKVQILFFSDKGGTGKSYHASLEEKNQRERIHYLLQPGWEAKKAFQGMGRTHRTNQASAPTYVLVSTDLEGHVRFISSIARRLDQLGALSKGQRETTTQGLFTPEHNLEHEQGRTALTELFIDAWNNNESRLNPDIVVEQMGLTGAANQDGTLRRSGIPKIPQFLNRILMLEIPQQRDVFRAFYERLSAHVERARDEGTLDQGLQNLAADATRLTILDRQSVVTDEQSGAKAEYIRLDVVSPIHFNKWDTVIEIARAPRAFPFISFIKAQRSGRVWAMFSAPDKTEQNGSVVPMYSLMGITGHKRREAQNSVVYEPGQHSQHGGALQQNYDKLSIAEAKEAWESEIESAPKETHFEEHLIKGATLPIWHLLSEHDHKMFRVQTTDTKERFTGRRLDSRLVQQLLLDLGAHITETAYEPEAVVDRVPQGWVYITNTRWEFKRKKSQGEWRIAVEGPGIGDRTRMERENVGMEIVVIGGKERVLLPRNRERAIQAVTTMLSVFNIRISEAAQPQSNQLEARRPPPRHGTVGGRRNEGKGRRKSTKAARERIQKEIVQDGGNPMERFKVLARTIPVLLEEMEDRYHQGHLKVDDVESLWDVFQGMETLVSLATKHGKDKAEMGKVDRFMNQLFPKNHPNDLSGKDMLQARIERLQAFAEELSGEAREGQEEFPPSEEEEEWDAFGGPPAYDGYTDEEIIEERTNEAIQDRERDLGRDLTEDEMLATEKRIRNWVLGLDDPMVDKAIRDAEQWRREDEAKERTQGLHDKMGEAHTKRDLGKRGNLRLIQTKEDDGVVRNPPWAGDKDPHGRDDYEARKRGDDLEERAREVFSFSSIDQIRGALKEAIGVKTLRRLEGSGTLRVVQHYRDLPLEIRTQKAGRIGDGTILAGVFDAKNNVSYLVADRVAPHEAYGYLLHELGTHYGLPAMLGEELYRDIRKQILELMMDTAGGKSPTKATKATHMEIERLQAAATRIPLSTPGENFADELLAYYVDDPANHNTHLFSRILGAVRAFFIRLGWLKEITPNDLVGLARAAVNHTARGMNGIPRGYNDKLLYATRPMNPVLRSGLRKLGLIDQKGPFRTRLELWGAGYTDHPELPFRERIKRWRKEGGKRFMDEMSDHLAEQVFDRHHGMNMALRKQLEQREERGEDTWTPFNQDGWVATHWITGRAAIMNALLEQGAPMLKDGVIAEDTTTRGLLDVFGQPDDNGNNQLPENDLSDFLAWKGAKRAKRLKTEEFAGHSKERNLDSIEIEELLKLNEGREKLFDDIDREFAAFNKRVLDFLEDVGVINAEGRASWEHADWIPFNRIIDDKLATIFGKDKTRGPGGDKVIHQLTGGTQVTDDLLLNIVKNWSHAINAGLKNHAKQLTVDQHWDTKTDDGRPLFTRHKGFRFEQHAVPLSEVKRWIKDNYGENLAKKMAKAIPGVFKEIQRMWAFQSPVGDDIIHFMREGKPVYYVVNDPAMLRAITQLDTPVLQGRLLNVGRFFKRLLTQGATATPNFQVNNTVRDTQHAWLVGFEGPWANPFGGKGFRMGVDSFHGAMATLKKGKDGAPADETVRGLRMMGSYFEGGWRNANDPKEVEREIRRTLEMRGYHQTEVTKFMGTVALNPKQAWRLLVRAIRWYEDKNNAFENAARVGLAKRILEDNPDAKDRWAHAGFEAKDLMDFHKRGASQSMQIAIGLIPFLNARLQALYKDRRSGALKAIGFNRPGGARGLNKQQQLTVLMKGLPIAAFTLGLYFLVNKDDPEYENLPDWEKDQFWHFFPGTPLHMRFARPFELGLLYATFPERAARWGMGDDSGEKTGDRALWAVMESLAINPIPQIAKPIVDVYANFDSFRSRPIENLSETVSGIDSAERFAGHTSAAARLIAKSPAGDFSKLFGGDGISPKEIDHLVRGYLGTLGTYALWASDWALRPMMGIPFGPAPTRQDIPGIGTVFRYNPMHQSQARNDLYEMYKEVNELWATINKKRTKDKDPQGAQALAVSNRKKLSRRPALTKAIGFDRNLRKRINLVWASDKLSRGEKRDLVDKLNTARNERALAEVERTEPFFR